MSTPKSQQKPDAPDTISLMELLIERDNELKSVLQLGRLACLCSRLHAYYMSLLMIAIQITCQYTINEH